MCGGMQGTQTSLASASSCRTDLFLESSSVGDFDVRTGAASAIREIYCREQSTERDWLGRIKGQEPRIVYGIFNSAFLSPLQMDLFYG